MFRLVSLSKYCLLTAMLVAPFIICSVNEQSPFELIKLIIISLATLLAAQIYFIGHINSEEIKLKWNLGLTLLFVIAATTLLSYVYSNDQFTSLWGNNNIPSDSLLSILVYFLFATLITQVINTYEDFKKIIFVLIISAFGLANYGIIQHFGLDPIEWWGYKQMHLNAYGTIGQAVGFATILGAILPMTLATYLRLQNKVYSYFLLIVLLVLLLGIMYSGSRMPMLLSLAISSAYAILFYFKNKSKENLKKIILFFGILAVSQAMYYGENLNNALTHKLKPKVINSGLQERIQVWNDATKIWKKYPWLGTGPENFALELKLVNTKEFNTNQNWGLYWHKAHNHIVHYLATLGVVGLLAHLLLAVFVFIEILKIIFKKDWHPDDHIKMGFLFGYGFIFLANLTAFNFILTELYIFVFPVIYFSFINKDKVKFITIRTPKVLNYINIFLACILLGMFQYEIFRFWNADRYYSTSRKTLEVDKDMQTALELIDKAILTKDNDCRFYLRKASMMTSIYKYQARVNSSWDSNLALRDLQNITDMAIRCKNDNPEAWFYKGRLFAELFESKVINSILIAEKSFIEGAKYAPANPIFPYNLGLLYAISGRIKDFQEQMRIALELKFDYLNSYTQLLRYHYKEKNLTEVNKIVDEIEKIPNISGEFLPELQGLVAIASQNTDYASAGRLAAVYKKQSQVFLANEK